MLLLAYLYHQNDKATIAKYVFHKMGNEAAA